MCDVMAVIPPDTSRDRRIEDVTNLYLIHPVARALVPVAIRAGISANAVSCIGLAIGMGAAWCFYHWESAALATLGFALAVLWLIADGLDGMVARATGTASPLGRVMDGICDHGVFVLIYLALAFSVGTAEGWALAVTAGVAHAVQSSLYEAERARFHRRIKGDSGEARPVRTRNPLERLYDFVAGSLDRAAGRFDRALREQPAIASVYGRNAAPAMKAMALLSANMRVVAVWLACLLGDPQLFWWWEIGPLTIIAAITILWHRRVETMTAGLHIPQKQLRP
jgi:CDP-diacylglycerol---serine O-phosphatidyltransferase